MKNLVFYLSVFFIIFSQKMIVAQASPCSNSVSLSGDNIVSPTIVSSYILKTSKDASLKWSISGKGKITNGQGTNSIKVKWESTGKATIKVQVATFECTDEISLDVTIMDCKLAVSVSGSGTVPAGTSSKYTANVANADSYCWLVEGGTIVSGQKTQTISVLWDSVELASNKVTAEVSKGTCSGSSKLPVLTYKNGDKYSNSLTFDTTCVSSEKTYSLPNLPYVTYEWSVYRGKIVAGAGTNSVKIQFDDLEEDELDIVDAEVSATMKYAGMERVFFYQTYLKKNAIVSIKPAFATTSICEGDSILLQGVCTEKVRHCGWSLNNVFTRDTMPACYVKKAGKYQFKASVANGCLMVSDIYTLKTQKCVENSIEFTTYPNPNGGNFSYELKSKELDKYAYLKYTVLSAAMTPVYSQQIGTAAAGTINIDFLQPGYYFISISNSANKILAMEKLIIVH